MIEESKETAIKTYSDHDKLTKNFCLVKEIKTTTFQANSILSNSYFIKNLLFFQDELYSRNKKSATFKSSVKTYFETYKKSTDLNNLEKTIPIPPNLLEIKEILKQNSQSNSDSDFNSSTQNSSLLEEFLKKNSVNDLNFYLKFRLTKLCQTKTRLDKTISVEVELNEAQSNSNDDKEPENKKNVNEINNSSNNTDFEQNFLENDNDEMEEEFFEDNEQDISSDKTPKNTNIIKLLSIDTSCIVFNKSYCLIKVELNINKEFEKYYNLINQIEDKNQETIYKPNFNFLLDIFKLKSNELIYSNTESIVLKASKKQILAFILDHKNSKKLNSKITNIEIISKLKFKIEVNNEFYIIEINSVSTGDNEDWIIKYFKTKDTDPNDKHEVIYHIKSLNQNYSLLKLDFIFSEPISKSSLKIIRTQQKSYLETLKSIL